MKEEIAKLWISDLRSGKYEQGTGCLLKDGKYCCLGVLSEISGLGKFILDGDKGNYYTTGDEERRNQLTPTVTKWAGMLSDHGMFPHGHSLAYYNDSGSSFDTIADLIEENWKDL